VILLKKLEIFTKLHTQTKRDYIKRMIEEKVNCMKTAKKYGFDFWDGERKFGYGGYKYDGRQEYIARELIKEYNLSDNSKILDVGCGKGFLIYEFKKLLPNCEVFGFDVSEYAIKNAKEEIKEKLFVHNAKDKFPFEDKQFDMVVSITTLHNLELFELEQSIKEIERVGKQKYIVVESYRNEQELFNLQCWALTCASFFTPKTWDYIFNRCDYTGDYEFIYFQ